MAKDEHAPPAWRHLIGLAITVIGIQISCHVAQWGFLESRFRDLDVKITNIWMELIKDSNTMKLGIEKLDQRILPSSVIYNAGGLFLDKDGDGIGDKLLVSQDKIGGGNEFDDGDPTSNSSPGRVDGVGPLAINRGIGGPLSPDFTPGPGVNMGSIINPR